MAGPDAQFWQSLFLEHRTPWDRGQCSPQMRAWLAQGCFAPLADGPATRVAVPGCGSGHEVRALAEAGCLVSAIDCAPEALEQARALWHRHPRPQMPEGIQAVQDLPACEPQWFLADVLNWMPPMPLDAVYEQTCLCALHPDHWSRYAVALHTWLKPGGRLFALFMQARQSESEAGFVKGPPYHVDIHAARALFPEPLWSWPKPPFEVVPHPMGMFELAVVLTRC